MARTHSLMILPEEIRQCEALFSTPRTDFQMIIMQAYDMNKSTCKLFVIPPVFFRALQFTSIIIGRLPSWIGPISRNIYNYGLTRANLASCLSCYRPFFCGF